MNINNNFSAQPQFTALHISKNTKAIMDCRGELDEFNKILPALERKAKKADITVYASKRQIGMTNNLAYGISIRPANKLKDNAVTKFFGLSKNKQGDSFITINNDRATAETFQNLYDQAYKSRNCGTVLKYYS